MIREASARSCAARWASLYLPGCRAGQSSPVLRWPHGPLLASMRPHVGCTECAQPAIGFGLRRGLGLRPILTSFPLDPRVDERIVVPSAYCPTSQPTFGFGVRSIV